MRTSNALLVKLVVIFLVVMDISVQLMLHPRLIATKLEHVTQPYVPLKMLLQIALKTRLVNLVSA
jgi:hypothetical protein